MLGADYAAVILALTLYRTVSCSQIASLLLLHPLLTLLLRYPLLTLLVPSAVVADIATTSVIIDT